MKLLLSLCAGVLLAFEAAGHRADDLTVATAPPVVVKITPQAGASDVDPGLKPRDRCRVTQRMNARDRNHPSRRHPHMSAQDCPDSPVHRGHRVRHHRARTGRNRHGRAS